MQLTPRAANCLKMATSSATFDVLSTSAAELQYLLAEGKVTGVQVVEAYLDQIEKHNHAGAKLRAIIATAERGVVLAKAAALDEERKNGHLRGPLHGIPIIVKDCFTYEPGMGLRTTVGSHAFAQEVGIRNAGVIQQVNALGYQYMAMVNDCDSLWMPV
jgi:amidase